MKDVILIAIISASSALMGSLIPTVITFFQNKEQNNFELKRELIEKQKDVYWELMNALQNIINNQGSNEFKELQKAYLKISIYGDNSTSKAMNDYFINLIKSEQHLRDPLSKKEHKYYQSKIINGMRVNLGLDEFKSFEIVGFKPENK